MEGGKVKKQIVGSREDEQSERRSVCLKQIAEHAPQKKKQISLNNCDVQLFQTDCSTVSVQLLVFLFDFHLETDCCLNCLFETGCLNSLFQTALSTASDSGSLFKKKKLKGLKKYI